MSQTLQPRTFAVKNEGQKTLVIVPIIILAFATLTVGLRFYAQHISRVKGYADDYLALAALVLAYGGYVANLVMVLGGGGGIPITDLTRPELVIWFKGLVANYVFWVSATAATQLSLLCFYLRVFHVLGWFRIVSAIAMSIVAGWWVSAVISEVTACIPLQAAWTPKIHGKCVNDSELCTSVGLIHIVLDFVILAFPIPLIWRLHKPRATRITIMLLLLLGVFASICSILRMSCIIPLGSDAKDKTGQWMGMLYQVIEAPVGIFCISVPRLRPVWAMIADSQITSKARSFFGSQRSLLNNESKTDFNQNKHPQAGSGKLESQIDTVGKTSDEVSV